MGNKKDSPSPYSNFDQLLINGQWHHGKETRILSDLNLYTGDVLAEIPHVKVDKRSICIASLSFWCESH
ncbi:MAG: hypothetical protein LV471_07515 [Nitrosomonas sp.]|nr:hypothetical protein [Nitrosomonas sp.]